VAETQAALLVIDRLKEADVTPPILKKNAPADPAVVACALALHFGQQFDHTLQAKEIFGVAPSTDVRGRWVQGKLAKLLEVQKAHSGGETFYPDANSCLRLSAGHVEGYKAADAVRHTPVTTLAGLVDKHLEAALSGGAAVDPITGQNDFAAPSRLVERCLADPAVAATPVCVCYSTDTVGGNSGSPVLDAEGRFVAINFDRQRQGLMNEFKWSHDYSRSIGTDVRYILFLVGEYDGAKWLVDEMVN